MPTFKMPARPCKILNGLSPGKLGYAGPPGIPVRFAGIKCRKKQKCREWGPLGGGETLPCLDGPSNSWIAGRVTRAEVLLGSCGPMP